MLAAVFVILVIGAFAFFIIRKVLPRIRVVAGKHISILETAYLGPRKTVHLLQVGSKKILVANFPEGVVSLGDVTDAFGDEYAEIARRLEDGSDTQTDSPSQE